MMTSLQSRLVVHCRLYDRLMVRSRRKAWLEWARQRLSVLRPDLVHAHFGGVGAEIAPICDELRIPLVVTFYGVEASALLRSPAWKQRYQTMFRVAEGLVDLRRFCYSEPRTEGPVHFLTAARFIEKKGYLSRLKALAKLRSQGLDFHLKAFGYGRLLEEYRRMAQDLSIDQFVEFIDTSKEADFLERYAAELRNADIFVLPSTISPNGDDEAGPALRMIMAQAAGLPVVCTLFPGSEISVVDGTCGFYCRPDDPDSLADPMLELARSPERCSLLGQAGSSVVHSVLDQARMVEAMVQVYSRILR
jgi:colanic acid/amylovoran biosynthesis glycosyltransferase